VIDGHRRTVDRLLSGAGITLIAMAIVLPVLRPHQIIAWAVAIGFAAAGVACLGASRGSWGRHHRVLDVAGGTGSFLIVILRRHPALPGTLFELPGACAVARRRLIGEPEAARIAVVEGDFFKDPLPDGHDDAVIVANAVHALSAAHNVELLKRLRVAAAASAR